MKIFEFLVDNPDLKWRFIDATYVKDHQHSSESQGKGDEGVGKSRGGEVSDHTVAPVLVDAVPSAEAIVANRRV